MSRDPAQRLGIDVGGTYTDLVLLPLVGEPTTLKVPTVPDDPAQGVLDGLEMLDVELSRIGMIVHGSTIGVNAVIQGTGATTGLLTTEGFTDVLEIGTMSKPDMYNIFYRRPRPLVAREHRLGVRERMAPTGDVLCAVDECDVREKIDALVDDGVTSVAIATLHAYANPENERRIAEIVRGRHPQLTLSLSHRIANQRREFERSSTTVVNAYIAPPVEAYLRKLLERLRAHGFGGPLFIMKSNGGVMSAETAAELPVHTLLSGPVAGSIAGRIIGAASGAEDVITFDMGGTSCDVSVILGGNPQQIYEANVGGHPVMTPLVDIDYIGAGGGSIATVIGEGSLRVGPASAGALPGPACYGKGGTAATVSDANVVLGRLDPGGSLAGGIPIRPDLAQAAVAHQIAEPLLALDLDEAALGIVDVANVKMAYAIRAITIEQGLDPQDFTLVAFGGAGPLHAPFIAQMVGIRRVIIPRSPGTVCAWGMINTDLRHDVVRTVDYAGAGLGSQPLAQLFAELEEEGREMLLRQGVRQDAVTIHRAIDMRYRGQEHTLTVGLPGGAISDQSLAELRRSFDAIHLRRYAHASEDRDVEFVNVRVEAVGRLVKPGVSTSQQRGGSRPTPRQFRSVAFADGRHETPVYRRHDLSPGVALDGPAIIEEPGCTSIVPPGFGLSVDERTMLIEVPVGS